MSKESGAASGGYTGTERVLALSDGVFAVAITLLALDLLPSLTAGEAPPNLLEELGAKGSSYVSYMLSFLIIGITWTNHHQIFTQIKRSNHLFLLLNIIFLMWVAAQPFPAAMLAAYLPHSRPAALPHGHILTLPGGHVVTESNIVVALYAGTYLVGAILFNALWRYGIYKGRLMGDDADHAVVRRTTASYYVGPVAYVVDLMLSLYSVEAGLALFLALALYYALAPLPGMDRLSARTRARV